MKLTKEQKDVIDFKFENTDTLLVNALAGTGKTSTLNEFANKRPHSSILYLAFNRSIAEEAKQKMVSNVSVSTCHSLAFKAIGKDYKDKLTNNLKAIHICEAINDPITYKEAHFINTAINSFCQSNASSLDIFFEYSDNFALRAEDDGVDYEKMVEYTKSVFNKMAAKEMNITHNFYLKLYQLKKYQLRFDYVLLDEAQDANDVILDIIANQTHAKKVIVGDHFQQIYKWNGSIDALRKVSKDKIMNYKPKVLYLTQSFRCSEESVQYANQYLKLLSSRVAMKPAVNNKITNNDIALIARTNAKLFENAISHDLRKIHFLGGFDSYKFEDLIDVYYLKKGMHHEMQNKFYSRFPSLQGLKDYAENTNDIEIENKINMVMKYDEDIKRHYANIQRKAASREDCNVVVTTAHKSKGQEFSCIMLTDDYFNVKDIIQKAELLEKNEDPKPIKVRKEEFNVLYVAYTRSLNKVESPFPAPTNAEIMHFKDLSERGYIKIV